MGIKILIYGCDVGGANALGEVIEALLKNYSPHKAQLQIFSKGLGYKVWKKRGFAVKKLLTESKMEKMVKWADIVFTATSYPADTEISLWKTARGLRKPTVVLLDFWSNYIERFTDPSKGNVFWPDKILVMDEMSKKGLINCNAPAKCIEITGQPFLERRQKDFSSKRIPVKTGLKGLNIMFLSQPLHNSPSVKKLGYDEFNVLDCIVEVLNSLAEFDGLLPNLVIRAHPRENRGDLKAHLDFSNIKFKWSFDKENNPDKTIARCQFILGISSTLLIEAALANKTVVSIQPELASEDPFPMSRLGYCKRIDKPDVLKKYILERVTKGGQKHDKVLKNFVRANLNSCKRIVRVLLSYEKR